MEVQGDATRGRRAQAAEDEAERRLRRDAGLMAEVMSAEGASESSPSAAGDGEGEENSREERLRAALAAATAEGERAPRRRARRTGTTRSRRSSRGWMTRPTPRRRARRRRRFERAIGPASDSGRLGEARVTGAATLREGAGGRGRSARVDRRVSLALAPGGARRDASVVVITHSYYSNKNSNKNVVRHDPNHAFPNFPLLGSSPSSPCTFWHFNLPASRKQVSIALTALEMDASSPFSCQ